MLGRCLVLNQSYEFLEITSWYDAICLVIENKATPLAEYNEPIRSQKLSWKAPSVIVMKYYIGVKKRKNSFNSPSKRNLLIRDGFHCQYCSCSLSIKTATIDHIIPRSKGGKHTLENTIATCKKCNNLKGDISLQEFTKKYGYSLRIEPRQLTEEEKINCLLKTVKSKERNAWLNCLKENNINLY